MNMGNSLTVHNFTAKGTGSTPGQGMKISQDPGKCVLVAQLCPTLCSPMNYKPIGSSARGILQARILQWVAIPFSRGSSRPRD